MHLIALLPLFFAVGNWKHPRTAEAATIIRASGPTCWNDDYHFEPTVFRECMEIISNDIGRGYDIDEPFKFSFDPSFQPDIRLPKYWTRIGLNCGVGVDLAPGLEGYDRTTLRDIKAAALAVAIECVIKPPHVGGYVQLGWHHKLGVLISGRRTDVSTRRNSTALH